MKLIPLLLLAFCLSTSAQTLDVIGDSYVQNHQRPQEETWHSKMAQQLGFTYHNLGKNGASVAFDRTHDFNPRNPSQRWNFGPALWAKTHLLDPQADYVLIIGGHNDADKIGSSRDSLAMFCDSLQLLIDNVRQRCPNARIGYVTPWYCQGAGFKPVCKAIRRICRRNRIPLLWNYTSKSPIQVRDESFRRQYFQRPNDTAHLNAAGHDLFLPYALRWFREKVMKRE